MSLNLDLFDPPRARRSDPATSHAVAAQVSRFARGHYALILETLRRFGEAGAEQIAGAIQLDAYQVRKRLPEMERGGLVTPTNDTRLTATGRHERIWKA